MFALDRGAGVAQVLLIERGRYLRVLVEQVNGTRRGRSVALRAVRSEFEARAGVSFNAWPDAA